MSNRRAVLAGLLTSSLAAGGVRAATEGKIALILAPLNLGLRPGSGGHEPGTWRAPATLLEAGLARRLRPVTTTWMDRPKYRRTPQPGTRVRNGPALRHFSIDLAASVADALRSGAFPVVVGGDCSILLGCLLGARRAGRVALVHIDGHSDFFHPGNYDSTHSLGAAAGMDLALATGHGDPMLTVWPGVSAALVADADAAQVGERDALSPDFDRYYGDIRQTKIERVIIQDVLEAGVAATVARLKGWLDRRGLDRVWLHVDLDVLDARIMPAVDSPGSPGLDYSQLAQLLAGLRDGGRVIGVDFAIYDPDLDPKRVHAPQIVDCIARALA